MLAAGKGERLWPLTESIPKHLLPIANKPVLERTLGALVHANIREILLVIRFRGEEIRELIGDGSRLDCEIRYVNQKRLGGTADAVAACREELQGKSPFLVIYGDDYYHREAAKKFLAKVRGNSGIAMATAGVGDSLRFGSLEVKRGLVAEIREKVPVRGRGQVNVGLYLMDQSIFAAIEKTRRSGRGEFELTDSLNLLIKGGNQIHAYPLGPDQWLGISYPWDLLEANQRALQSEKAVLQGKKEDGAHIKGPVVTEQGSVVKSGSYIEGPVHLGRDSVIGPNAYLRSYSSIGNDVKIGAGCEVKNSIIMDNAKIPHLSYVGDSIIGAGCSLGAGTITANLRFDEAEVKSRVKQDWVKSGRKKLGAVLGDNVRTGINVSILPGVKIGRGAWVGPGAIVNGDVAAGARMKAS